MKYSEPEHKKENEMQSVQQRRKINEGNCLEQRIMIRYVAHNMQMFKNNFPYYLGFLRNARKNRD
jgi:hypothetical protein